MKAKILVLGHKGMLGRTVFSYLKDNSDHSILSIESNKRWPSNDYKKEIDKADIIINCAGSIPQKTPMLSDLFSINTDLPLYLISTGKKVIHASTDCEYSGSIPKDSYYSIEDTEDAKDEYGISKRTVTKFVKDLNPDNFKIIRTSIIGVEESTSFSLLNWACSNFENNNDVNGFDNHYWNGITTLEWSKIALRMIDGDLKNESFIQPTIKTVSKYDLLNYIKNVFNPDSMSHINKITHEKSQNKSLATTLVVPTIEEMLSELKEWRDKK
jgi:dTDP-4-dehydrorhamnose reductase